MAPDHQRHDAARRVFHTLAEGDGTPQDRLAGAAWVVARLLDNTFNRPNLARRAHNLRLHLARVSLEHAVAESDTCHGASVRAVTPSEAARVLCEVIDLAVAATSRTSPERRTLRRRDIWRRSLLRLVVPTATVLRLAATP